MLHCGQRLVLFISVVITVTIRLVWQVTLFDQQMCGEFDNAMKATKETNVTSHILSDAIIVRAAYRDPRPRDSFPFTSVFLAEVRRDILQQGDRKIVACGSDVHPSRSLKVRVAKHSAWIISRNPLINHEPVMIDCFGLPELQSGTRVFLWVNLTGDGRLHRVESENTYFIPRQKNNQTLDGRPSIVVCMATVHDTPSFLKEFLLYYKHLGVDHVYMVAEDSFILQGNLEGDEFIKKALLEGFVSVSFWHKWLNNSEIFYDSQLLAYQNCIYRFQGTYDYVFHVDSDDHFIPLVSHQTKLDYYITHYCKNAGSCRLKWIEYYPDCGQDWSRVGPHGNVTNTILSKRKKTRIATKSIHLIRAMLDTGTHSLEQMLKGYKHRVVPSNVCYVAHLRKKMFPPNGISC